MEMERGVRYHFDRFQSSIGRWKVAEAKIDREKESRSCLSCLTAGRISSTWLPRSKPLGCNPTESIDRTHGGIDRETIINEEENHIHLKYKKYSTKKKKIIIKEEKEIEKGIQISRPFQFVLFSYFTILIQKNKKNRKVKKNTEPKRNEEKKKTTKYHQPRPK